MYGKVATESLGSVPKWFGTKSYSKSTPLFAAEVGSRSGLKKAVTNCSSCTKIFIALLTGFSVMCVRHVCLHKTRRNTNTHKLAGSNSPHLKSARYSGEKWVVNKMNKWALISIWYTHMQVLTSECVVYEPWSTCPCVSVQTHRHKTLASTGIESDPPGVHRTCAHIFSASPNRTFLERVGLPYANMLSSPM